MENMKLTGKQIESLADFADGSNCTIRPSFKWTVPGVETVHWIFAVRDDRVMVKIYEDGRIEDH